MEMCVGDTLVFVLPPEGRMKEKRRADSCTVIPC